MAKTATKTSAKAPKKTVAAKSQPSATARIESACIDALEKLKSLGLHQQLQNDIEWCLGSYRADGNPVGLYEMAERALAVFQEEKSRKTKGITAKHITDIEKALAEKSA